VAFQKLKEGPTSLRLNDDFRERIEHLRQTTSKGVLTSTKLLRPANYRLIRQQMKPTSSFLHVYQFVRHALSYFSGNNEEVHYFLTPMTPSVSLGKGLELARIGVRVHIHKEGIDVDIIYVNDSNFIGNGIIVHSFIEG
jgi:hypothetical protein